jgi:hypothetical protein
MIQIPPTAVFCGIFLKKKKKKIKTQKRIVSGEPIFIGLEMIPSRNGKDFNLFCLRLLNNCMFYGLQRMPANASCDALFNKGIKAL